MWPSRVQVPTPLGRREAALKRGSIPRPRRYWLYPFGSLDDILIYGRKSNEICFYSPWHMRAIYTNHAKTKMGRRKMEKIRRLQNENPSEFLRECERTSNEQIFCSINDSKEQAVGHKTDKGICLNQNVFQEQTARRPR